MSPPAPAFIRYAVKELIHGHLFITHPNVLAYSTTTVLGHHHMQLQIPAKHQCFYAEHALAPPAAFLLHTSQCVGSHALATTTPKQATMHCMHLHCSQWHVHTCRTPPGSPTAASATSYEGSRLGLQCVCPLHPSQRNVTYPGDAVHFLLRAWSTSLPALDGSVNTGWLGQHRAAWSTPCRSS
jgi:hypothetical protein